MSMKFEAQVALVTGAASGIGEAVAMQLAQGGAKVVVADMDASGAERVAQAIERAGGLAAPFEVNVANPVEVEAMVSFAERTYGALHLAVNNAGIGGPSAITGNYPIDGWQKVIDVNLNAVFFSTKFEIAAMLRAGGGAIVNMASILGSVGFANSSAYVAAKHGVLGFTKAAAIEYATQNIRINSVGPGFIDTPLLSKNLDPDTLGAIAGMHPMARLGRSEEVSALTCFLLSNEASFITGSYHLVDGGYVAR